MRIRDFRVSEAKNIGILCLNEVVFSYKLILHASYFYAQKVERIFLSPWRNLRKHEETEVKKNPFLTGA